MYCLSFQRDRSFTNFFGLFAFFSDISKTFFGREYDRSILRVFLEREAFSRRDSKHGGFKIKIGVLRSCKIFSVPRPRGLFRPSRKGPEPY